MFSIQGIIDKISSPVLLFFLAVIGMIIIAFRKQIGSIMEKFKFSDLKGIVSLNRFKFTISDLVNHDVFIILDERKSDLNPDCCCGDGRRDEVKNLIFVDFVALKMDSTIKNMKRIVTEYESLRDEKGVVSEPRLKMHVYECFKDCNKCLEKEIIRFFHKKKKIDKDKVEKLSKDFSKIRQRALNDYSDSFERVFKSPFYESNFQRINQVFENVAFESKSIVRDIEEAFTGINGMFKDMDVNSYE